MKSLRKSFIIHKDSLAILDELSNEQAGLLFKAIKDYQNGETIMLDDLTRIILTPFKAQFSRDNEKYKRIIERNTTNGNKGGRPKKDTENNPGEPTGLTDNPEEPTGLKNKQGEPVNGTIKEPTGFKNNPKDTKNINGSNSGRQEKPSGLENNPLEPKKADSVSVSVSVSDLKEKDLSTSVDVLSDNDIFEFWRKTMEKSKYTKFTVCRKKAVAARRKEGYSAEIIQQAIIGCSQNPHNNGTDKRGNGQRYDCLELICRTGKQVERFADNVNRADPRRDINKISENFNFDTPEGWQNE